ncbi:MAG: PDZ domain-containing protein [Proteobacteria bacterium]|nr:PDZ domain-containing protein [Pseudomonadota bacterium]MCP4920863.1 PDZ domain-containing protein [Pseudomonadota bacterium]
MSLRVRQFLPVLGLLALASVPARADAPDLYSDALSRIDSLYLDRGDLLTPQVFAAAAQQLEIDVEWLMVSRDGSTVTLALGDGQELGQVTVAGWNSLGRSLRELEALVVSADRPLEPDLDLRVVLLSGVTDALDRHSRLLYGERLQAFDKRLKGTFYGIGARIGKTNGALILEEVFPSDPADQAGLESGDVLLRIDGESTVGMTVTDAVARITGPKASQVELDVRRDVDGELAELTFVVPRQEIKEPNVEWKALGDGFGYIRIDHFSELTESYLSRALIELDADDALRRGLVIDLRDNTGGSMMQSANSADAFVKGGDLVHTVGRDGGKVNGLVAHIWAADDIDEPDVPIVVLQNHRTASGSEILAGSLRELDRGVLIGTRTYGKGTVQKLYTLEPGVRLKLTVAEYLLAGGLSIHDLGGIPADLPVGEVQFGEGGVAMRDDRVDDGGPEPLLFVDEHFGWREGEAPPERDDVWLDLAVRVLALSRGSDRGSVLEAAGQVRELVRAEEEQRLIATYAARDIDWAPASGIGEAPQVEVELVEQQPLVSGKDAELRVEVTNLGDEPLHRVLVRLDSDDKTFNRMVLPVGVIGPARSGTGSATVRIRPGLMAREAVISATVESDGRPDVGGFVFQKGYAGSPPPEVELDIALVKHESGDYARVELTNLSEHALAGLLLRFEYPESAGVVLTDEGAAVPSVGPDQSRIGHLGLDLSGAAEGPVPLHVIVDESRFGEITEWALEVPQDGSTVRLRAPAVKLDAPTTAPVGVLALSATVSDEQGLDHVTAWGAGDKLLYQDVSGSRGQIDLEVDVVPGRNRYVFDVVDDQGLRTRRIFYVRGELDAAVTEGPSEP